LGASHESSPESVSPPENDTVNGAAYQPFPFAGLDGAAFAVGFVESYFSVTAPEPELPALSRHAPATEVEAASGPENVTGASHVSTPDVASLPAKETESEWLCHPFESAGRLGDAVTPGTVASY